jgi:hypothetical protein
MSKFELKLDADSLICSLGYCVYNGHTVHNFSQRFLTADWLDSWESDCSRLRSKVSFEWLPSYIKTTQPILEIFKRAGYFPDRPHMLWKSRVRCSEGTAAILIWVIMVFLRLLRKFWNGTTDWTKAASFHTISNSLPPITRQFDDI